MLTLPAIPTRHLPRNAPAPFRIPLLPCLLAAMLVIAHPAGHARAEGSGARPDCGIGGDLAGIVARGGPHGELVLTDGTSLRPADLWIAGDGAVLPAGTAVTYRRVARSPDRWGRWPARIAVADAQAPGWLAHRLVADGRALVRPETAEAGCIAALLAAEAQAGRAERLPADDLATLSRRYGTFVVAEGLIHSVGVRERLTYLNFGQRWSENLAVAMTKSLWTQAASRSMTAPDLEGRRVRVRGVLERGSGPIIRIGRLDEIELVGDR